MIYKEIFTDLHELILNYNICIKLYVKNWEIMITVILIMWGRSGWHIGNVFVNGPKGRGSNPAYIGKF